MARNTAKIIDRVEYRHEGVVYKYVIRMARGCETTKFLAEGEGIEGTLHNDSIDALRKEVEKHIRDGAESPWTPWVHVEFESDTNDPVRDATEDDRLTVTRMMEARCEVKLSIEFFVSTKRSGKELWKKVPGDSIDVKTGEWEGKQFCGSEAHEGEPRSFSRKNWHGGEAYCRDALHTYVLLPCTPEILMSLARFQGALHSLAGKIHDFLDPKVAEKNLLRMPMQNLLTGGKK